MSTPQCLFVKSCLSEPFMNGSACNAASVRSGWSSNNWSSSLSVLHRHHRAPSPHHIISSKYSAHPVWKRMCSLLKYQKNSVCFQLHVLCQVRWLTASWARTAVQAMDKVHKHLILYKRTVYHSRCKYLRSEDMNGWGSMDIPYFHFLYCVPSAVLNMWQFFYWIVYWKYWAKLDHLY